MTVSVRFMVDSNLRGMGQFQSLLVCEQRTSHAPAELRWGGLMGQLRVEVEGTQREVSRVERAFRFRLLFPQCLLCS